jgi:hypothetical protein
MKPSWVILLLLAAGVSAEEPPRAIAVPEEPAAAVPVAPPASARTPALERATSRTEQFRVSGADGLVRGTVALIAEDAKTELLALTGEKDEWKVPVSIFLHGQQGDPLPPRSVAMKLLFSEAGYDLRVDVHLSRGIEMESFKHTITAALLYERALRGRKPDQPEAQLMVPPWLVEGLREATAWRMKRGDRRLYETLFKHGGLFKLDELFAVDEADYEDLDGAMRAAFRGSSGALLMALLQQPQGREGFRTWLSEVAAFQGEMPVLLRRHFPDLNLSETSLAKWWVLQLAEMTTPSLTDVLGIAETEAALTEALQLNFRAADGTLQRKPLEAWQELAALKEPERFEAVRLAQDSLVRISYRCFPSFRPLIAEYQLVLSGMARGKTKKSAADLVALRQRRDTMVAKCTRAGDYLDWFEITRARETSGMFEDYLRLKERLAAKPHNRTDPLSSYLDRLDRIFKRKGDAPPPALPGQLPAWPGTNPAANPIDLPPLNLPPPGAGDVPIDLPPP